VADLSSICFVVHKEKVEVGGVLDEECLVPRRHHVASLLVRSETDRGHDSLSLEASSNSVIDTLGFPPCRLDSLVAVALVATEPLGPLLDDRDMLFGGGHLVNESEVGGKRGVVVSRLSS